MAKYRKKPVVIEAVQYKGSGNIGGMTPASLWEALKDGTLYATNGMDPFIVKTLKGSLTVAPGHWIIKGVQGELYPCKPDIFEQTYDLVEDE